MVYLYIILCLSCHHLGAGYGGSWSAPWRLRLAGNFGGSLGKSLLHKTKANKNPKQMRITHLGTEYQEPTVGGRPSMHRWGSFAYQGGGKSQALPGKALPLLIHERLSLTPANTSKWTFSPLAYFKVGISTLSSRLTESWKTASYIDGWVALETAEGNHFLE